MIEDISLARHDGAGVFSRSGHPPSGQEVTGDRKPRANNRLFGVKKGFFGYSVDAGNPFCPIEGVFEARVKEYA